MDKGGQITSIIKDKVEGFAVREGSKGLIDTPQILLLGFSLPCKDRDASSGNTDIVR